VESTDAALSIAEGDSPIKKCHGQNLNTLSGLEIRGKRCREVAATAISIVKELDVFENQERVSGLQVRERG